MVHVSNYFPENDKKAAIHSKVKKNSLFSNHFYIFNRINEYLQPRYVSSLSGSFHNYRHNYNPLRVAHVHTTIWAPAISSTKTILYH
jgi:hypothetical protein